MADVKPPGFDLRAVNQDQFSQAKWYWTAANVTKLVLFGLGAWAVFGNQPPQYLPQVFLGLVVTAEILQLRSDGLKGRAESTLRTLDLCRSFGRDISVSDKRDIIVNVPRHIRKRHGASNKDDVYFASIEAAGPRRAVENLLESAWYTRHQAWWMAVFYVLVITGLLVLSVAALMVAARHLDSTEAREHVVRLVTAWLLLIVSLNMLKAAWAYFKMYERCQKIEASCVHLLSTDPIAEQDALRRWAEYHVSRASAPLVPQWLWELRRSSLDEAWRVSQDGE